MLHLRSLLVAAVLAAAAVHAAPCTDADTAAISAIIEPVSAMLTACKSDTSYELFPFSSFPTDTQQRSVCNGRSCPAVLALLREAALPSCTFAVDGEDMTATEFLAALCESRKKTATA